MEDFLDRQTEGFSQGQRTKTAIARALVHDPKNVILDEPTNGLDVMTTRGLLEFLKQLRGKSPGNQQQPKPRPQSGHHQYRPCRKARLRYWDLHLSLIPN